MADAPRSSVVVGAGAFGVAAALELRRRGWSVDLVDPGPLPHPQASSTDISKAVRMDYGKDAFYADLAARALEIWRQWNDRVANPLYHEVGILLLADGEMRAGGFEGDSFEMLRGRGVPLERLDGGRLADRFPAWSGTRYADGYFNPVAGWAASGDAVRYLLDEARRAGVRIRESTRCTGLVERGASVVGIRLDGDEEIRADAVVVAAGAWTPVLLPHLAEMMTPIGQPVMHLEVPRRAPFEGARFPVWCADIANTGWYGFPVNIDGVLKLAHHGPGRRVVPGESLELTEEERERFREFVGTTFPTLANAKVHGSRVCLYCDSWDGNFLIDRDPDRPGLAVAAGGSGHGFKFAPILGEIVADAVEGRAHPTAERFGWRKPGAGSAEQARLR